MVQWIGLFCKRDVYLEDFFEKERFIYLCAELGLVWM